MLNYLRESHNRARANVQDFYTPTGVHVYIKDPLNNDGIDIEKIVAKVEERIPEHLLSEVEMIIVGWFDEFEERSLNAFYKDGILHISNIQDNESDMLDDFIHEIAHSIESPHGYEIYGDQKVKDEFLRKRRHLHDKLWALGFKAPLKWFENAEYDEEFDKYLLEKVGYDKLRSICTGLFINAYAPTSLREYFATGFTDYFLHPNHNFLKRVSPSLYEKLLLLQDEENLDTIV